MDKKNVKRRGGGRPNRGGGRQNRRGRGQVNTRPPGPSVSGRKVGSSMYDDDDMYDPTESFDDDDFVPRPSTAPPPQQYQVRGVPSQHGRGRGSSSSTRGRGGAQGSSSERPGSRGVRGGNAAGNYSASASSRGTEAYRPRQVINSIPVLYLSNFGMIILPSLGSSKHCT